MTTTPIPGAERTRVGGVCAPAASPRRSERMRVGTKLLLLAMLPVGCVAALVVVSAVSDFRTADRLSSYRAGPGCRRQRSRPWQSIWPTSGAPPF